MSGYYAASKKDALKQALELIPEESTIAMGGCVSAMKRSCTCILLYFLF